MKNFRLYQLHPFTVLCFFLEALVACFVADKAGLAVIFVFLLLFSILQKKAKTILWTLPLAGFMLILNPVFYHGGETVLFQVMGFNFTWEAVENGIYCALLILCTTLLFTVLGGSIISEEKFLYVFGRVLPKTALMIAMIFKHFDVLRESYRQCKNMALIGGIYENDTTLWQKIKTNAVVFEAFTGAALEGSIDTALSLSAKGYYRKHKTRIKLYAFRVKDIFFLALSASLFGCTFIPGYPGRIALGLFFAIPLFFVGKEVA